MRILLVSDFYPPIIGGMEHHVRCLAMLLSKRGHKVQVLTSNSPRASIENDGKVKVIRAPHTFSRLKSIYTDQKLRYIPPMPDPLLISILTEIVKKFCPDIVHAHGWSMFTAAALKKKYPLLPIISSLHNFGFFCPATNCFNEEEKSICYGKKSVLKCLDCARKVYGLVKGLAVTASIYLFKGILNDLDQMIAVSSYVRNMARKAGFHNIITIPNFVDLEELPVMYNSRIEKSSSRSIDILFVGALIPNKGVNVLQKAFEILEKKHGVNANLTLVGKTNPRYLMKISNPKINVLREGVSRNVVFEYMQISKIVVIPSVIPEACPTVALEAMAFKKPIVASAIGGLTDVINNGKTGFLVPPNDAWELAKALKHLLERPNVAKRMGLNGYQRVIANFSGDCVLPQIENLYERLSG